MEVENLEVEQRISCMYAIGKGCGCAKGIVRKITPKTFIIDIHSRLITIKKSNVLFLKLLKQELNK